MDALIEDKKSLLQRFILWREKRIKEKHFILILSFLVGIFTALAAWFLKFLVEWIKEFLTENFVGTRFTRPLNIMRHTLPYEVKILTVQLPCRDIRLSVIR